jgi:hypothetical protein
LILAVGGLLILSGPLRAAWHRAFAGPSLVALLPATLSAGLTLALLFSLTEYANAFSNPWPAVAQRDGDGFFGSVSDPVAETLGLAGVIVQSLILAAFVVALAIRWRPPLGMFTVVFGVATTLVSFSHDWYQFIPVALVAGIVADSAADQLAPSLSRPVQLRLLGFVVLATPFILYFMAIALTGTLWWSIDLVTGTIVLAGLAGLGMAQLALSVASQEVGRTS